MAKERKRANGEGSVYKRKDGRWTARMTLPIGKRKDFFGKTRAEVNGKLIDAMKKHRDGLPVVNERQTVAQFLASWLESAKPALRTRTHVTYEGLIRLHVSPGIGRVILSRLTPQHLQRLYSERLAAGLSPQSVRHLHAVIHRALEQAARWSLVHRKVADLVTPPRVQRHEMRTLDPEQARRFLNAATGDRLEALYVLALTTGMRLGELLALRWRDVDLDAGSLSVRGTLLRTKEGMTISEPKTAGSRRHVSIGGLAIDGLRRHRVNQTAERLLKGPAWQDNDLVFANEVGKPIEDTNLRRRSFEPLLAKAGVPRIRFHDLRHTAATLLLGQGIHPKIVSERLGHSRVSITLDLYSHVTPTMQRQAVEAMETLLRA
ncbi:MAG TPA: site-specific integrase [Dehalococcoidia bacterium]